jgi:hypothetical protein
MHQEHMSAFTAFHVALSLVGILTGIVALAGFFYGRLLRAVTAVFLLTTIATSVTGFFFPFHGITPGIVLGVVSLIVLALALLAYGKRWSRTFVLTCALAEFLNVLVLVVQSFQKISRLHVFAPKGNEPIVATVQLLALLFFIVLATLTIRRHRFVLG